MCESQLPSASLGQGQSRKGEKDKYDASINSLLLFAGVYWATMQVKIELLKSQSQEGRFPPKESGVMIHQEHGDRTSFVFVIEPWKCRRFHMQPENVE